MTFDSRSLQRPGLLGWGRRRSWGGPRRSCGWRLPGDQCSAQRRDLNDFSKVVLFYCVSTFFHKISANWPLTALLLTNPHPVSQQVSTNQRVFNWQKLSDWSAMVPSYAESLVNKKKLDTNEKDDLAESSDVILNLRIQNQGGKASVYFRGIYS